MENGQFHRGKGTNRREIFTISTEVDTRKNPKIIVNSVFDVQPKKIAI
jgi:5-deoxy-D-glucuronate isomerase